MSTNDSILGHGTSHSQTIKRLLYSFFPAFLGFAMMTVFSSVIVQVLAGMLLGTQEIAAISLGYPPIGIISILGLTIAYGAGNLIAIQHGKGEEEEARKTYSIALKTLFFVYIIISVIVFLLAEPVAQIFAAGSSAEMIRLVTLYLRVSATLVVPCALMLYTNEIMTVQGNTGELVVIIVVGLIVDIVASYALCVLLKIYSPENALAGLVFGYAFQYVFSMLASLYVIRKKTSLRFVKCKAKISEVINICRYGLSNSINTFIDFIVLAFINTITLSYIGEEAVSIFAVVSGLNLLFKASMDAIANESGPLFGLMYGSQDRNGTLSVYRGALKVGAVISVVWLAASLVLLNPLIAFYGFVPGTESFDIIKYGCFITMPMLVFYLVSNILAIYYESIGQVKKSLGFAVLPDSVIFPLTLIILINILPNKYTALFASYNMCYGIYLAIFFAGLYLKHKKVGMTEQLSIAELYKDSAPLVDLEIKADDFNAAKISDKVSSFMTEHGANPKTAFKCSLAAEELVADIATNCPMKNKKDQIIDVRMVDTGDDILILIRNTADRYDALDYEYNNENFSKIGVQLVRKIAKEITYTYVFKMNFIRIVIAKQ